jgi:hypothetical protein
LSASNWKHSGFLYGFLLLSLAMALANCARSATPTITPPPTPDALDIYTMLTAEYTSPSVIATIYDMSADNAARIVRALQAIEPPPGLETLHEQAVNAYRHICAGKLLLPGADAVLRSEAYFMVDWGIALLKDYEERLAKEQH